MSKKSKQGATQPKRASPKQKKSSKPRGTVSLERDGWLATLANPWGVHGIRIPDEIIAPSATCTFRQRLTLNAVQDGTTGKYATGVAFFPTVRSCYKNVTAYNSTDNRVTFGASSDVSSYGTFNTLSRGYRTVSAGIGIFSSTAMAQNSGRNLCAFYPGNDRTNPPVSSLLPGDTITTFNQLQAENSEDSPINQQMVCSISWVPSDRTNYAFHDNSSYSGGTVPANTIYNNGACIWIADGLTASASFEVHIVINVEFYPNTNSISFFTTLPSRYDVLAMERALNSSLISKMFHTGDPESIMNVTASNNVGLTSMIGQLVSNFGMGAISAIGPYASRIGQYAAFAGMNRLRGYVQNGPNVRNSLLGINN